MQGKFFELGQDLLCVAAPEGRFVEVNEAWTRTLGWTAEELCSRPFSEFVHPDDRDRTGAENDQLARRDRTLRFRNRYRNRDGEYHWLDWRATVEPATGEIYAAARDITREVLLHQELTARQELLTAMVAKELRTREDEHRRISGDLHDTAVQHAIAALMFLDLVPVEDRAVAEPLDTVRAEVAMTLEATRKVIEGLDPLDLGDETFEVAVRAIAEDMQGRFGLPVEVSAELDGPFDTVLASALCRMVREALVNAAKHAQATRLSVSIGSDATHKWAAVRDDGRGMDAAGVESSNLSGMGLGLAFLQDRARALHGNLEVASDETGTTVSMRLPRAGLEG